MKIKLLFSLVVVMIMTSVAVLAYNYDITIPVKGNSIASKELQGDSLFTIYSFALRVAEPSCQDFAITDTKVAKPKTNGVWEETWTIKACSKYIDVPVRFTEENGKSSYFVDSMRTKVRTGK